MQSTQRNYAILFTQSPKTTHAERANIRWPQHMATRVLRSTRVLYVHGSSCAC